jgi:hypothetical protein
MVLVQGPGSGINSPAMPPALGRPPKPRSSSFPAVPPLGRHWGGGGHVAGGKSGKTPRRNLLTCKSVNLYNRSVVITQSISNLLRVHFFHRVLGEPQDHIRDSYLEKIARSIQTPWILYKKAVYKLETYTDYIKRRRRRRRRSIFQVARNFPTGDFLQV